MNAPLSTGGQTLEAKNSAFGLMRSPLYIISFNIRFYNTHPSKDRGFISVNVTMLIVRVCNIS